MNDNRNIKQVIVVRKDLNMRRNFIASQVAHAAMKFIVDNNEAERMDELRLTLKGPEARWLAGSFTKIIVGIDSEMKLEDLIFQARRMGVEVHSIVDESHAEFGGVPTLTCAAFGPDESSILDDITGKLKSI